MNHAGYPRSGTPHHMGDIPRQHTLRRGLSALAVFVLLAVGATGGQATTVEGGVFDARAPYQAPASKNGGRPVRLQQSVVSLTPVSDATVASISPDANLGHEHTLAVGYLSSRQIRYALLRFNLAEAVPSEAVIDEARLDLFLEGASGIDPVYVTLSRVTEDWSESTVTWNGLPGFDAPHLSRTVGSTLGTVRLDVTPIARAWHNAPHYGLLIHAYNDGSVYDRVFESREHGEMPPELVVTYHLPEPVEHHFYGHVFHGSPPDRQTPLVGASVGLWGDDDEWPENGRTLLVRTASGPDGHFALHWEQPGTPHAYLHVVEEDPPGLISTGARSDDQQVGYVKNFNVVSFRAPPSGEYTGLAFWDDSGEPTAPEPSPTATREGETPEPTPSPSATLSPDCVDIVDNGDFETGAMAPWLAFGAVGLGPGRQSPHGAWLGGADTAFGELLQPVGLPAGATLVRLTYGWLAEAEADQPGDHLDVIVQYGEEQADHLRTHRAVEPRGVWQQGAVDLTEYAGREVAVTFLVETDGELPSVFRVDDVTVHVCGWEPGTPTATATEQPTATATAHASATRTVPPTRTPTEATETATPTAEPSATATPTPPDQTHTWIVNTTADHDDGACEALDVGDCTLREALARANDRRGPDTVRFEIPMDDPGYDPDTGTWTIEAVTALPDVVDDFTVIDGGTEPEASAVAGGSGADSASARSAPRGEGLEAAVDSLPSSCACGAKVVLKLASPFKITGSHTTLSHLAFVRLGTAAVLITGANAKSNLVDCTSVMPGTTAGSSSCIEIGGGAHGNAIRCSTGAGSATGILIDGGAYDNTLTNNYMGPVGGTVGNNWGVFVAGGAHDNNIGHPTLSGKGNVLSGNLSHGVLLGSQADDNLVRGNWLGVLPGTLGARGNAGNGVHVWSGAKGNTIGPDNIIAYNHQGGVVFSPYQPPDRNEVTWNKVYDNLYKGILNPRTKPPIIQSVGLGGVSGTTNPPCAGCRVEIFGNPSYKPSPFVPVQGETPLASVQTQSDGTWSWSGTVPLLSYVTATLTDKGDTSEFASPQRVTVKWSGKVCPPGSSIIECFPDVTVTLWKKQDDRWKKAGTAFTNPEGAFEISDDAWSPQDDQYLLGVTDPRYEVESVEAGEGGEGMPDGTVLYRDVEPRRYADTVFRAASGPRTELVVNTTADSDDGRCQQPPDGDCSLREAVSSEIPRTLGRRVIRFDIADDDPGFFEGRWTLRLDRALPELVEDGGTIDATRHPGPVSRNAFADVCSKAPSVVVDGTGLQPGSSAYVIKGGHWSLRGLVLKGWSGPAVRLTGANAHHIALECNQIVDNLGDGVRVDGGAHHNTIGSDGSPGTGGNLISGNGGDGVRVTGANTGHNVIARNLIGVDLDGVTARPNTGNGVRLDGGAEYNDVGGELPVHRNVISGNGRSGIMIEGGDTMINRVGANLIGLGADGTTAVGNGHHGVGLYGGTVVNSVGASSVQPNHIAANGWSGVAIVHSHTNAVNENTIGADPSAATLRKDLGNTYYGVHVVGGSDNSVVSNRIGANGGDGIRVEGAMAVQNILSLNSIHANGGKAIELIDGGNAELPPPSITSVTSSSVAGRTCSGCTVEVFADPGDEARDVHSPPYAFADRLGFWSWTGSVGRGNVAATTSSGAGNTSELSSSGWRFAGQVTVGTVAPARAVPMPAEVRLYGSARSGDLGTLLGHAATARDGSFEIHYGSGGDATEYPVLTLAVVDPAVAVERAESASGGLVSAANAIEYRGVPRGLYAGNVFHLVRAAVTDPGIHVVPWKIPTHPGPVTKVEPVDFIIEGIEVTQAVQCYGDPYTGNEPVCNKDNALPLAAGKPTVVRVYATTSGMCFQQVAEGPVEVKLHVMWDGKTETKTVTYNAVCALPTVRRKFAPGSANFFLDVKTDRDVQLWAEVNTDKARLETDYTNNRFPVSGTEVATFKKRLPVTVGYVLFDYQPKTSVQYPKFSGASKPSATWAGSKAARERFEIYTPSGSASYVYGGWLTYTGADARDEISTGKNISCGYCDLFAALQKYWKSWTLSTQCIQGVQCDLPGQVVGWLPKKANDAAGWGGYADAPPPVWTGTGHAAVLVEGDSTVLAHEVGHNLGLRHAPCPQPGSPGAPKGIDPNWPDPTNALVGQIGIDVPNMWPTSAGMFDYMSYCAPEWISPYHWNELFEGLAPTTAPDAAPTQGGAYVIVGGTLTDDGSGQLDPLLTFASTGSAPDPLPGGDTCIAFYDGAGIGLASHCFASSFDHPETYAYVGVQPFSHALPLPPGAARVALRHEGRTVATRAASLHRPTVRFASPAGAERWDGVRTVAWSGADEDGDPLRYLLMYSSDDGANWRPVAVDLDLTSFELDTTQLAGSEAARLRLVASDGFHSTQADSPAFAVVSKAPVVTLDQPDDNAVLAPDTALFLSGSGHDAEDGLLAAESLSWWSDRDGLLGRGDVVILPGWSLSGGKHAITLRGADHDGRVGHASVEVYVGYRANLPAVTGGR